MYFKSDRILTDEEVRAITDWTDNSDFDIEAKDMDKFVIYVRIEDNAGNVTLIGEATGGDTGNGPRPFCTKQRTYFRIPTRQPDVSSKGFPMEGIGIPPHHQVSQTVADFMKDEDTVLNYAVGLITEKQ